MAVLAVNPFQPQNFRSTPEDLRSPVVFSVWVGLYDGENPVSASYEANRATMGAGYDNQIGANDCCYWTGNHLAGGGYSAGWGTVHRDPGYNDYADPGFQWSNWGSGYDDFEIEVVRESNGTGFARSGEEDATITFTGGDYWALVEPSDGERPSGHPLPGSPPVDSGMADGAYYVPVYYDTYVLLNGDR